MPVVCRGQDFIIIIVRGCSHNGIFRTEHPSSMCGRYPCGFGCGSGCGLAPFRGANLDPDPQQKYRNCTYTEWNLHEVSDMFFAPKSVLEKSAAYKLRRGFLFNIMGCFPHRF